MSNSVIPFNYEGNTVRTVETSGETWFIAADVARVLEIGNVSQALTRLDDDERTLISNEGKELNAVSEAGLYALILGSRKPQAKPFRRWVFDQAGRRLGSAYQILHGGLVQDGGRFRLRVRGRWRHGGRRVLLGVGVLFR